MSTPRQTTLTVAADEELASLIDRAIQADGDVVHIVLDGAEHIAANVLNLRLIKREGDMVGKTFIVVARDAGIRRMAEQASLPVQAELPQEEGLSQSARRVPVGEAQAAAIMDIMAPEEDEDVIEEVPEADEPPDAGAMPHAQQYDEEVQEPSAPVFVRGESAGETSAAGENLEKDPYSPSYFGHPTSLRDTPQEMREAEGELSVDEGIEPATDEPIVPRIAVMPGRDKKGWRRFFPATSRRRRRVATAALGVVALAGLFFIGTQKLPRITLVVTPESTYENLAVALVADANIASLLLEKGVVPAQVLEEREERTFTFQATGEEEVNTHAEGTITVYNGYSSEAQPLVVSTRFLSADGKLFRTVENVVVPGARIEGGQIVSSSTQVRVRADQAGESHNIGPTEFSIPGFQGTDKYMAFYGKSTSNIGGGFSGVRTVATQDDIDNAKRSVEEQMLPGIEERLREKIPETLLTLDASLNKGMAQLEVPIKAGQPVDTFEIYAVAQARVFLVNEDDMDAAIAHAFSSADEFDSNFELGQSRDIEYAVQEIDYEKGTTKVTVNVRQLFVRKLDAAALTARVQGKSEAEVRGVLARSEELAGAQVRFWPFWVHSVPNNSSQIKVEVSSPADSPGDL